MVVARQSGQLGRLLLYELLMLMQRNLPPSFVLQAPLTLPPALVCPCRPAAS